MACELTEIRNDKCEAVWIQARNHKGVRICISACYMYVCMYVCMYLTFFSQRPLKRLLRGPKGLFQVSSE